MRIAIFADIHANREAFSACLALAQQQNVDRYIFLGDLIGYGADPEWTLDTLIDFSELGSLILLGNHDEAVSLKQADKTMQRDAQLVIDWTRSRLTNDHIDFLKSLPVRAEEGEQLFVHANPWAPESWDYVTDISDAKKGLAASRCRYVFVGHQHQNALYHQGATGAVRFFQPFAGVEIPLSIHRRWLAVIGSVGQPRDGVPAGCYAVFDTARNTITYYRAPFNVEAAATKIRKAGLPEWLATRMEMGV